VMDGCAPRSEQPGSPRHQDAARTEENAVRAVISELFKVDASAISMDKPISEPPLNADELDLVEIVMALEDRQNVVIPDEALDRYVGGKVGRIPVFRITPSQLASIVREASKQKPKRP